MKPSQLATLLVRTIAHRLPTLIVGGPGIGKTSIVAQACEVVETDLIVSHPAVSDPTDAKGLPWISDDHESATFVPFGETLRVLESERPTVWFWDDLGQAAPAVQASFMPWLLARRVNGHVLPDHVTIVAATNRRTDRAGVTGVLEPVKSRFSAIVELEPDLDEWCRWALAQEWMPPEVVAFLRFRPDELNNFTPTADMVNSPVPRTWENAARLLNAGMPAAVEAGAVKGAVGEAAGTQLLAFLKMYRELPSIDGILLDPDAVALPTEPGVLYAVTTAVAHRTDADNFPRVARYAERLNEAGRGEFAVLLLRDAARRDSSILQTRSFVELATGELGELIGAAR